MKQLFGSERIWANAFALYAVLFGIVFLLRFPPFMSPDELNHIKRADMVGRGLLLGQRQVEGGIVRAGGPVETSLNEVEAAYHPMEFHSNVRLNPSATADAMTVPWGSDFSWQSFENTAIYPPVFYVPSALGLDVGKGLSLPVVQSVELARLFNLFACALVGLFAIRLAGRARYAIFLTLTLPMTAMLFSSVTQDGLLIATTALGCAIVCRSLEEARAPTKAELVGGLACLVLVGMAKPPYVLFDLLLFAVPFASAGQRWKAIGIAAVPPLIWHIAIAALVEAPVLRNDGRPDIAGQLHFLLSHPVAGLMAPLNTVRHGGTELAVQVVGVFGWLDTVLPKPYYVMAYLMMIAAAWLTWTGKPSKWLLAVVVLGVVKLCIYGALYLSYTPVGFDHVEGIQGRYFLPVLAMVPFLLLSPAGEPSSRSRDYGRAALLLFPLVGLALSYHALAVRYF